MSASALHAPLALLRRITGPLRGLGANLLWLVFLSAALALAGIGEIQAQSNYTTPYTFSTLAGSAGIAGSANGTGSAAQFSLPFGAAVDTAGNLYVADFGNNLIRKITVTGVVTTLAGAARSFGSRDGQGANAAFDGPTGVAVDATGNVYVADSRTGLARKISPTGLVTTLNDNSNFGRFEGPSGIAVDGNGNVYVSDETGTVWKIAPSGSVANLLGANGGSPFDNPQGLALDSVGNVYVADFGSDTIKKVTPGGVVTTLAGSGVAGSADGIGSAAQFDGPQGICVDASGNMYVSESGNQTIREITPAGVVSTLAGSAGQTGAADGTGSAVRFSAPAGMAIDAAGDIYLADSDNATIRKGLPPAPTITGAASAGSVVGQNFTYQIAPSGPGIPVSFAAKPQPSLSLWAAAAGRRVRSLARALRLGSRRIRSGRLGRAAWPGASRGPRARPGGAGRIALPAGRRQGPRTAAPARREARLAPLRSPPRTPPAPLRQGAALRHRRPSRRGGRSRRSRRRELRPGGPGLRLAGARCPTTRALRLRAAAR
jgi:sugar lactone lactonase YvrE